MVNDPVIDKLQKHINAIAEMCNERIRPWEPDITAISQKLD